MNATLPAPYFKSCRLAANRSNKARKCEFAKPEMRLYSEPKRILDKVREG